MQRQSEAFEVLAKHDEEYMPSEVAEAMKKTHEPLQYTIEQKEEMSTDSRDRPFCDDPVLGTS